MTAVLMGRPRSINVRKALWALDEVGADYRHEPWGEAGLSLNSDAFVALNPNRLVPVYREGEIVLWESNSICRFVARKAAREDLLPQDFVAAAAVEMWMDWSATTLAAAWRYAFMALMRDKPGYDDPGAIARSVTEWNGRLALLDAHLAAGGPYACGDHFTLADICLGLNVHRWRATPIDHAALPALLAYDARLRDRQAYRHWAEPDLA
ncbi:glutathione S-transferase [Parvularcula bermudensis HTCC2503]|uniref:Glutathione S-transferase n=1 Tax=Parvularcula bermudensis (strain ATCC BAA-594 / HTCC2503 / KCTC 12087) TaxID=314260 RepID=E0TFY1_PARBH|nr:glutathione S-transferase N-terminal domain-containing protein [Parvularcula bermudensis]ADM10100.1 glutathione S-transferase [Parvularcula bermudensis HTCC2503]